MTSILALEVEKLPQSRKRKHTYSAAIQPSGHYMDVFVSVDSDTFEVKGDNCNRYTQLKLNGHNCYLGHTGYAITVKSKCGEKTYLHHKVHDSYSDDDTEDYELSPKERAKLYHEIMEDETMKPNVKKRTMKMDKIEDAALLCKRHLPSQSYGPLLETWIKTKLHINPFPVVHQGLKKHSGDGQIFETWNVEIKVSLSTREEANFVQLRWGENIHLYVWMYFDLVNCQAHWFMVPPSLLYIKLRDMNRLNYAHGSKDILGTPTLEYLQNEHREIRFSMSSSGQDKCWNAMSEFIVPFEKLERLFSDKSSMCHWLSQSIYKVECN